MYIENYPDKKLSEFNKIIIGEIYPTIIEAAKNVFCFFIRCKDNFYLLF
jgi:hypothetical protein